MKGATAFSIAIFLVLLIAGYFVTVNNILPDYFSGGSPEGASIQSMHSLDIPLQLNSTSYISINCNSSANLTLYILNNTQFQSYAGKTFNNVSYDKRIFINVTYPPVKYISNLGSKSEFRAKVLISSYGTYWIVFFNGNSKLTYIDVTNMSVSPK